jgi:hypothetical protein
VPVKCSSDLKREIQPFYGAHETDVLILPDGGAIRLDSGGGVSGYSGGGHSSNGRCSIGGNCRGGHSDLTHFCVGLYGGHSLRGSSDRDLGHGLEWCSQSTQRGLDHLKQVQTTWKS